LCKVPAPNRARRLLISWENVLSFIKRVAVLGMLTLLGACQSIDQKQPLSQEGFTELKTGDSVQTEVRYFSSENFVGEVIDGYQAPVVYLTRAAHEALQNVIEEAESLGYGIKVFDAYRPQQAVDHFVRWAGDLTDVRMKAQYYPAVEKQYLFRDGYIASRSGHSRGSTLDLTLFDLSTGVELDMGTAWDFFDLSSWSESRAVTIQQQSNRGLLRTLMGRHGFQPLREEWWHFTLENEPYPETYFNFPIR